METQIIKEGKTKLKVPKLENYRTSSKEYVPSKTPVFFNPIMEISRDISVSSVSILKGEIEGLRVCDPLAGVGARGIRYGEEINDISEVLVNDRSDDAAEFIRENIRLNDLSKTNSSEKDANSLLHNYRPRFHAIDIDPFGSPIPFLDSSLSALSGRGIFLVTATDTAPLCGAYPKPCIRKYGAKPLRTYYSRELGLRIFIASVQKRAAAKDLALTPVLSHATQHFFRIHFKVKQGAKKADRILEEHGYVSHCFQCDRRSWEKGSVAKLPENCQCGREMEHAGPLWLEDLGKKDHIQKVIEEVSGREFEKSEKERNLLRAVSEEAEGPPTFYDLHDLCSQLGISPPKIERVIKKIRDRDYFASRTHFSGTGLKTNAPMDIIMEVISGND